MFTHSRIYIEHFKDSQSKRCQRKSIQSLVCLWSLPSTKGKECWIQLLLANAKSNLKPSMHLRLNLFFTKVSWALLAPYLLAKQLHLMFVSSPSPTQGWLLKSICLRLQRFKPLPLSHYLQICPCNMLLIIFTGTRIYTHNKSIHPIMPGEVSNPKALSQSKQAAEDYKTRHKSKKRCLEIFMKTFALLPSLTHLFHGEKEKKAGDFCDKSPAMKCCETLNVACISLPSAQTPNLRRTLRSWKLGRKENAADAILGS